ncbi:DUF3083 family protein [Thalassotalea sp. ND16A]|uniref:DUF3083 family protein n=1 Tax=Thalassotalea sp. ND16A TaxID=1535422 RepID=UPI000519FB49|nr:DUF3083 family protein [Thalassotalea sp. ND16A]KGJ99679.1 hypothetical protein ND16A_3779 [Thalassotalea sp. ND16A]
MGLRRSKTSKVYLPSNSRYSQFLLAEFKITDNLIEQFEKPENNDKLKPWQSFYQQLSEQLFTVCEAEELNTVHFIANDKLPRVRFSEEVRHWKTEQQITIFYNPEYHQCYKAHFDGAVRAKKVSLLFLATGDSIRTSAADFHQKVSKAVATLIKQLNIPAEKVRLRDHQHLTYDLFAKDKNVEGTNAHTLRLIRRRYKAADFILPEKHDTISYVVASIPVSRKLIKRAGINLVGAKSYSPLYQMLSDASSSAATQFDLKNGAFIANGLTPIVRNSSTKPEQAVGELQMLGFDPQQPKHEFYCSWQDNHLVDYVQIIFAATEQDIKDKGYSKFVDNVDKSLRKMANALDMTPERDEIAVRFHQHLAYSLNQS